MQVATGGLDLAKNIFQVHGVSENSEVAFNQALRRARPSLTPEARHAPTSTSIVQ